MMGGGFLVVRRDQDNRNPFVVGDPVTTYELDEPLPFVNMRPHGGHDQSFLDYIAEVEKHIGTTDDDEFWREESAIYCSNCPAGRQRKIVSVMVHIPSARRWVSPRAEKKPADFRDNAPAEAWPMHGASDEMPCVGGVASCPGCKKRWLVVSTAHRAYVLGLKGVRYGAVVAE